MNKEDKEKTLTDIYFKKIQELSETLNKFYIFAVGTLVGVVIKFPTIPSAIIFTITSIYLIYFNFNISKISDDWYIDFCNAIKNDKILTHKLHPVTVKEILFYYKNRYKLHVIKKPKIPPNIEPTERTTASTTSNIQIKQSPPSDPKH